MIILKVTKKQISLSLSRKHIFRKTARGSNWPPPVVLGLRKKNEQVTNDHMITWDDHMNFPDFIGRTFIGRTDFGRILFNRPLTKKV